MKGTWFPFRHFMALGAAAAIFSGCVMKPAKPTKVTETEIRQFDLIVDKSSRPVELTDQTVILDARSSFDYGLNRITNSIHFPWDNLAETTAGGEVMKDARKAALRLSLNGLEPKTPVVIVGNGPRGDGGEGRLAWTLIYLGFHDVQVSTVETFRKNWTQNPSAPAKNVPVWPLIEREELQMSKADFARLAKDPKGRLENRVWIIDVRGEKEYANRAASKNAPDINALHMPWGEFYNDKGRPNPKIRAKLEAIGIIPKDRVILISNKGVRSGAAAYALLAMGFTRVQNFTGGWNSLLTDRL